MPNPFNLANTGGNTNLPEMNQDVQNLMNMFRNGNPMQLLQIIARQNPKIQPYVQMLQNGATFEQVLMRVCQEKGANINALINQYKPYF